MVNFGWGLAVFAGVIVAYNSGAHINPAVTLGLVASGATEFSLGVAVTVGSVLTYIAAQLLGAIIGAVFTWLAYKQYFDDVPDAGAKLAVFSTGPAIRSYGWNLVTEIIGTFVRSPRPGWRTCCPRRSPGSSSRYRYRCFARWSHRLRHQPSSRPGPENRSRPSSYQGQGLERLELLLGSRRRPHHRWCSCRTAFGPAAPHRQLAEADRRLPRLGLLPR